MSVLAATTLAAVSALGGSWGPVLGQTAGVPPTERELAEPLRERATPPAALEYRPANPGIESRVLLNAPQQATATTAPVPLALEPESQVTSEPEASPSTAQQGAPRTAPGAGETRRQDAPPPIWLTVSGLVALGLVASWGVRRWRRRV